MKKTITIALDENYAPHAAAVMAGAASNIEGKVDFYLLGDKLKEDTKQKLIAVGEKFSAKVFIIEANAGEFFVSDHLSRAAYLRLKIPELLPNAVKRTVYLDGDLLVVSDISELFETDLEGKPLGAAADLGIMTSARQMREKRESLNMKHGDKYFNSGVLVIDLDKWRENNYTNKLLDLVKLNNFRHHDQDALNMLFYNNWYEIPLCYNVIPPIYEMPLKVVLSKYRKMAAKALKNAKIIHYAGGHKPWHYNKTEGFNDMYYDYLEKTPFTSNIVTENKTRKLREQARLARGKFWAGLFG
ncbi:MAG: glycosyltransferase family 8 protein [Selenomonadaceae bacterium]|nr:glycosyltransferase family 8 protein [Selenomonadaceae bacterium]